MKMRISGWVVGVALSATSLQASSKLVVPHFPEESFRREWDRGCSDWKSFLPESENVAIRFERSEDRYWLWGHARVRPERGETLETLLTSAREHLSTSSTFLEWIMPGINEHPRQGASYFVELDPLRVDKRSISHVYLTGPFRFGVPGLQLGGHTTIELKWEDNSLPKCSEILKSDARLRVWRFRMFPRPDVLEWMMGEMIVVPSENARDVIIKIRLALKPATMIYRLLPSKLIESELRFRAERVLGNFVEFRRSKVWKSGAGAAAGNPASPEAAKPKKAPRSRPNRAAKIDPGKSP
jgi:hypothetical protein